MRLLIALHDVRPLGSNSLCAVLLQSVLFGRVVGVKVQIHNVPSTGSTRQKTKNT